ncbi:Ryanodine receptor 3 [Acipenser ruthenus]|uniref:Ryanodine receptor 3 n=1 Tax=Acipenser ruthenus TaxID=7906 RepID=A0A444UYM4_ACIRT|nr:Ryanodine receptor 3 [Acipenser ruthenus]
MGELSGKSKGSVQSAEMKCQDDEVVLQCVSSVQKEQRKFCLSAEGLGNRLCFLEPTSEAKYVPPDLCVCNFVLEQALSVRALQEMLANTAENAGEGVSDAHTQAPTLLKVSNGLLLGLTRWQHQASSRGRNVTLPGSVKMFGPYSLSKKLFSQVKKKKTHFKPSSIIQCLVFNTSQA